MPCLLCTAAATTTFRDQAGRTFDPINLQQPKHLTPMEPEQLPRCYGRQSSPIHILQPLEPPQLAIRSSAEPSPQTPPQIPWGSVISDWQRGVISILRLQT